MTAPYTKKVDLDDGTNSITLGGESIEDDLQNEIESFAEPNADPPKHRALNLNRIKEVLKVEAVLNDEIATELNSETDKESAKDTLKSIFTSRSIVTLTYGSDSFEGYLTKLNIEETGEEDNRRYQVTFQFLKASKMNA